MIAAFSLQWVEKKGQELRNLLNLSPTDVLDPIQLAHHMGVLIFSPQDIPGLPENVINQLLIQDVDGWSAGCIKLPNSKRAVIYNSMHPETRIRATVMEELAHIYLGHKAISLLKIQDGISIRSEYNEKQEKEAYWVGAAALLPLDILRHYQTNKFSRNDLATNHGVSVALVKFRENVTHTKLIN